MDRRYEKLRSSRNPKCLAVDLGAGSGRIVLGEISGGRWELSEVGRFQTPTAQDSESTYQRWDLDGVIHELGQFVPQVVASRQPVSIGIDSWGVDYVFLDDKLQPVGVPVCYRDRRTTGKMESIQKSIARDEIYRRTGIQFLPFNTLYQLAACIEQEPAWMQAAHHFLMIPDYLHFRFCGALSNEYTNATTTQMCDLSGKWDSVLMDAIGLQHSLMQDPIPAGTVLGHGTGIAAGLKVIAPATHDTASAVAGTPLEDSSEAYISSGTWSLMGIESATPLATGEALAMNFTNEGGFERRFRVLKNIMGMWPIQKICEERRISDFAGLVGQAEESEPWRSIIEINDPRFLNPPSMTEAIQQYCRESNQPLPATLAEFARCIFDSLALSYKSVKEQIEFLRGQKLSKIRIVGGGCQNHLLNQLCADACGLAVIAGPIEASALGNLSAQLIALGELENLSAARALIPQSFELKEYQPKAVIPSTVLERFVDLFAARELKGETCA
jgi:rhamnulokinase